MRVAPAQVIVDCNDPFALADWWRQRLGWREVYRMESRPRCVIAALDGSGRRMCFVRVPNPRPDRNHLRVTILCEACEDAAAELQGAGARVLASSPEPDVSRIVMADPEGNLFEVGTQPRAS
jgi:predicted enzyme related to lactoylglutathione lyase